MDANDEAELRAAIDVERRRAIELIAGLQQSFTDIVEGAELTSTDDEHDPEGATIAYERAQVSALLRQWQEDLRSLDGAVERLARGTALICEECGDPIGFERLLALPRVRVCISCAASSS